MDNNKNGSNGFNIDDFGEVTPELHKYMKDLIADKKKKGLPVSYMEDKRLVREYPDGRKYIIQENGDGDIIETPYGK